MSSMFKSPSVNVPAPPVPTPPPPMPDPYDPAAMEAAKTAAAARSGRSSTILTTAANRGAGGVPGGTGVPYGGKTLGGG